MTRFKGDRWEPADHYDECTDSDEDECICDDIDQRRAEQRAEDILDDMEYDQLHG